MFEKLTSIPPHTAPQPNPKWWRMRGATYVMCGGQQQGGKVLCNARGRHNQQTSNGSRVAPPIPIHCPTDQHIAPMFPAMPPNPSQVRCCCCWKWGSVPGQISCANPPAERRHFQFSGPHLQCLFLAGRKFSHLPNFHHNNGGRLNFPVFTQFLLNFIENYRILGKLLFLYSDISKLNHWLKIRKYSSLKIAICFSFNASCRKNFSIFR